VSQRGTLVKNMLRRVLLAARGSSAQSVTVVGGGVNVRRIASKYFAEWTASLGNDLNADLMDSIKARESEGFSTIYLPCRDASMTVSMSIGCTKGRSPGR
jgi:2-phospho-L-lactate guanylyltransferase (CobY/MobA/RfbA family)